MAVATEVFRKKLQMGGTPTSGTDRLSGVVELIVLSSVSEGETVDTSLPRIQGVIAGEHGMSITTGTLLGGAGMSVNIAYQDQTITVTRIATANTTLGEYVSLLVFG